MRTLHILLSALVVLGVSCSGGGGRNAAPARAAYNDTLKGTLQLSGAFALYPLAVRWAEEFRLMHPHVRIDISGGGAGKGMTDALTGMVDIGMVSRDIYPEEKAKGALPIAVVRDAVLPTINVNNPDIEAIRSKGLSRANARKLWKGEFDTWGQVLGTSSRKPVHVFTRSDACGAAETFAAWLGTRQEDLEGTAVFGDPGVASAIQKDKVGIGYNNIAYVYDQRTGKPFEGIMVLPIDLNGDGHLTADEDFYGNVKNLMQAVNAGLYPSPPARELYMVLKGKPTKPALVEFLHFVLTDGQRYASEIGFVPLQPRQLAAELEKLK